MTNSIFIGVDAGTSQIKCVAYSPNGSPIAMATCSNLYNELPDGRVEQGCAGTYKRMLATLCQLITKLGADSQHVAGLAITAMGDGMVLVDTDGEPLHDGWLWLDSRAASIVDELELQQSYDDIFRITGTALNASQMRSQMLWMDRHQPELLNDAHTAFHWKDYLYYCLTGVRATDPSEALFTFGSFHSGKYDSTVVDALGLTHRAYLLPPIVDGTNQSHELLADVATKIGLEKTVPVTLGYVDVICSALGGGLYNQGRASAMTIMGTTGIHMRYAGAAEHIQLPTQKTGYTIAFPAGGFVQLQTNMAATLNIDWILDMGVDILGSQGHKTTIDDMLLILDEHISSTEPSGVLYHPYISNAGERGPFFDTNARASFEGLERSSGYFDLVRSVIEGMCFAARDCYESLGEIPAQVRLTGGAAKSVSIQNILASILNRPVQTTEMQESGAAGAVMIATVQHGVFDSMSSCAQTWLDAKLGETVLPDSSKIKYYDAMFTVYQASRQNRIDNGIWDQLVAVNKQRAKH